MLPDGQVVAKFDDNYPESRQTHSSIILLAKNTDDVCNNQNANDCSN